MSDQLLAPVFELFFSPLEVVYEPSVLERVQFAYFASKYGHKGRIRDSGERYFNHPKRAAWIYVDELKGRDPRVIIGTLLHDMSEDSYLLSPYRISLNFDAEIALDIRALTKLPKGKEDVMSYLDRIMARGPWAITAKLCDRLDNLRTLDACSEEKKNRHINETIEHYLPILIPALKECGDHWAECAVQLEMKIRETLKSHALLI